MSEKKKQVKNSYLLLGAMRGKALNLFVPLFCPLKDRDHATAPIGLAAYFLDLIKP